jgi:hypothetical protein
MLQCDGRSSTVCVRVEWFVETKKFVVVKPIQHGVYFMRSYELVIESEMERLHVPIVPFVIRRVEVILIVDILLGCVMEFVVPGIIDIKSNDSWYLRIIACRWWYG